jgi:ubiquinone/menaquinone biosynthesis C-methylase UbiE
VEQSETATGSARTGSEKAVVGIYSKRAARYNVSANLYYLIGVRVGGYRRRAVNALRLRPGGTVLDLACGTGANFPWLEQAVGPAGHIIGVDLTPDMLNQAQKRMQKNGWTNVELLQAEAGSFNFPILLDGVVCTYAISLMPNFAEIIQKSATALKDGGRMAVLDVRYTSGKSRFLNAVAKFLTKPFGSSDAVLNRNPWEVMPKYLSDVQLTQLYLGFLYIAVGTKAGRSNVPEGA